MVQRRAHWGVRQFYLLIVWHGLASRVSDFLVLVEVVDIQPNPFSGGGGQHSVPNGTSFFLHKLGDHYNNMPRDG